MKKKNTVKKIELKKAIVLPALGVELQARVKGGATDGCNPASALCSRAPLC